MIASTHPLASASEKATQNQDDFQDDQGDFAVSAVTWVASFKYRA